MEKPTPRVNSQTLAEYTGKLVRIVGKVKTLEGDVAHIEASDGGEVIIRLSQDADMKPDGFVEVLGKVLPDQSVQGFTSVNMGTNIDMDLVNQVTLLTQKYPDLFPTE